MERPLTIREKIAIARERCKGDPLGIASEPGSIRIFRLIAWERFRNDRSDAHREEYLDMAKAVVGFDHTFEEDQESPVNHGLSEETRQALIRQIRCLTR